MVLVNYNGFGPYYATKIEQLVEESKKRQIGGLMISLVDAR